MNETVIDVQKINPTQRHALIFKNFDELPEGDSLLIVNDHNPLPLLRQFQETRGGQYKDEYLQSGPGIWKVRITRQKKEGCCGFCGE